MTRVRALSRSAAELRLSNPGLFGCMFWGSRVMGAALGRDCRHICLPATHHPWCISRAPVDMSNESSYEHPQVGLWAFESQLLWVPLPQHYTGALLLLRCGRDWSPELCPGALLLGLGGGWETLSWGGPCLIFTGHSAGISEGDLLKGHLSTPPGHCDRGSPLRPGCPGLVPAFS